MSHDAGTVAAVRGILTATRDAAILFGAAACFVAPLVGGFYLPALWNLLMRLLDASPSPPS